MSYSYGPMGNNPMHTIMPIMGNMGNGANFLPPLGPSMQPMPGPSIMSSMAGLNDSPLEFNIKKMQLPGAGPMELETVNEMERDRENRLKRIDNRVNGIKIDIKERDRSIDRRLDVIDTNNAIEAQEKSSITPVNSMNISQSDIIYNRMMGVPQGFMMMPNMMNMMEHPMLGIQQFPMMSQMSAMPPATQAVPAEVNNSLVSLKEIISCKSCTLFPPNPNAPLPTTRERPPGCRTVFVGGLPENITEDIIREVFERCGEITTLRLSKKNFCHIRFVFEASVDSAIYLSGYRIRIGNNTDATNCGRLHVDYAQARDDQYEWECRQRQLQREQRHRERLERDRLRPLSPPPIVHYTDHEAATVSEKLKQDDSFAKAVQVLITWLERGDCSKKNANNFYTMIQSTNSHVRRLLNEKTSYEEELAKAKEHYKKQMQSMMIQFTQIEKVFNAASHKKVWDHFTKAQRKNIDMWKKQSTDVRSIQLGDIHDDDEMEMSDDEKGSNSGAASTHSSSHNHNHKINCGGNLNKRAKYDNDYLKEENDSLRCQLEAYKNEVNLVKSDLKSDTDIKEHQIKMFQETIRSLQTQLLDNKAKEKDNTNRINELENKLKAANVKELLLKTKILNVVKLKGGNIIGCASNNNNNNNNNNINNNNINSLNTSNTSSNSNNSNNNNNNNTDYDDDTNEIIDINDEKLIFDTKTSTLIPAPSAVVAAATAAAAAAASQTLQGNITQGNNTIGTSSTTQLLLKNEMIDIDEARIIGLVSTFLVVHPFGASTDYIWSYVHRIAPQLRPKGLEEILSRYNTIFLEEITGIGAKIERKWKFSGFDTNDDVNSQE